MSGHSIYTCQRGTERCEFVLKAGQDSEQGNKSRDEFIILLMFF